MTSLPKTHKPKLSNYKANQCPLSACQRTHGFQFITRPGCHFFTVCDFRFVQHVGKPRRNDKQDNPNRQEAEEPLQPANLDTGNFADELQTSTFGAAPVTNMDELRLVLMTIIHIK